MLSRFKKTVAILLAFILFVTSLCTGCKKSDDNSDDFEEMLEALSQYYESEAQEEKLDKTEKYRIIIPAKCGVEIYESAAFLSQTLSKYVGYEVEVEYDADLSKSNSYREILIGRTDREESDKFLKGLKYSDYGYGVIDEKILIASFDDEKCAEAVELFADKLVSGDLSAASLKYTKTEIVRSEYELDTVKLNGFELCEYTIVYPQKGEQGEARLAQILRDTICEKSGYYLPIVSDKDVADSARAICVGSTAVGDKAHAVLSDKAYIYPCDDGNIELLAEDNYGIYTTMNNFCDLLFSEEQDRSCEAVISEKVELLYDSKSINFFILRDGLGNSSVEIYRNIVNSIYGNDAAYALFEFCSDKVITNLEYNIGAISMLGMLADCYINSDEFIYKKLEHNRIDDGMIISVVLERISDGKEIAVVRAMVNDGGPSDSSDEFYEDFSEICRGIGDMPALIIVDKEWNSYDRFVDEFKQFTKSEASDSFFFTAESLWVIEHRSVLVDPSDDICADIIKLKPYYK